MTWVEPSNSAIQNTRRVYLAHIGQIHYVSTCSALCDGNSNQINIGKTNDLSEAPKNDAGSCECIINTKECPERIIAHYNIDVEKYSPRQNKQPKNSEIIKPLQKEKTGKGCLHETNYIDQLN